jgi:hypothetical protein
MHAFPVEVSYNLLIAASEEFAVSTVRGITGVCEPGARAIATVFLRGCGLALIGSLLAFAIRKTEGIRGEFMVLLTTHFLGLICQSIN